MPAASAVRRRSARRAGAVLLVGGNEPTGRMGLLADLETVRALGSRATLVVTALTGQGRRTRFVEAVTSSALRAQLRALLEEEPPRAVKIGLVPSRRALAVLRELLSVRVPWVVDPVTRSSTGLRLSSLSPRDYLELAAPHVVLTPNLLEARALTGLDDPVAAGKALAQLGFGGVVVKGGHASGDPVDWVISARGAVRLRGSRLRRRAELRGTGCRFSSALAAHLARGASLAQAARAARRVVRAFLASPILPA